MSAGLFRRAVLFVLLISGLAGTGAGFDLMNQANTEFITASTYNIRVAVRTEDIDYWINTRRHQVFESIVVNQPDLMGFQEAYARRSNGAGVTQQTALGQLFEGTQWRYFSWEAENVFNMNPFIVNTDRFLPVDYGTTTVNFEDFLGAEGWNDYFELHRFFHGDKKGNVHYLGPERYVNWVVADDLMGGGRVAFLTSHYETYIGDNHRGSEYDELFEYWSGLVNSAFGYASRQIIEQAENLKSEWGDLEVIICGDFETTDPELPSQREYTDAGFVETWRFINGNGRRPTRGIDNMFVMPDGFNIDDSYYDEADYTKGASDHKPLYAQLTISNISADLLSFQVRSGTHQSGDVNEVGNSDDTYLVVRSARGGTAIEPFITDVQYNFQSSATNPGSLSIRVESHIDKPVGIVYVSVKNINTGEFDRVSTATVGTNDIVQYVEGFDPDTYMDSKNGDIIIRVKHVVIGTYFSFSFDSYQDEVVVIVE